jgi:LPS-assembly protein
MNRVKALTAASLLMATAVAPQARAQLARVASGGQSSADNNAPVTFQADSVSYDRDHGLITATGHVEAWQNGNVLHADRVTFDRNTNVAAAYGHVSILQPDGETMFGSYAELTQGMKEGVIKGMRGLLTANGKLAANGVRRNEGKVNELSRVVYTSCNVCAQHPEDKPLWQLRAYDATQDLEHKRIEYEHMYMDVLGVPVFYLPYFSMPDPSVKRQSGFLIPDIAFSSDYLGSFVTIPYYYVIGPSSDITLTPLLATGSGPQLSGIYRRKFNNGVINVQAGLAYDSSTGTKGSASVPVPDQRLDSLEGYIFLHTDWVWNDHWHYGADINLATAANYLRDYRIPGYGADVLESSLYVEGFGIGSYARLDALAFQGINQTTINNSTLPYVLPRYIYDLVLPKDDLGGTLRVSTEDFGVYRPDGASDQRGSLVVNWDRPAIGPLGTKWTFSGNLQSEAYNATSLTLIPDYYAQSHSLTAQALPTASVRVEWPLVRLGRGGSSQTIEPIVQLVAAPNSPNSANDLLPNEDSLNYNFSDTTLFQINRFDGIDRQDSGLRANVGVHGNWTFGNGMYLDGLVGESFRAHVDNRGMLPLSGLEQHASDIVERVSFVPRNWLDFTASGRYDHDAGKVALANGLVTAGVRLFKVSAGYIYSDTNPYYVYDGNFRTTPLISDGYYLPRNEITLAASSAFGRWGLSAFAQRNLSSSQYTPYTGVTEGQKFDAIGADVSWQNECVIANLNYSKRYTFINGDNGDQTILFTLTFKTLGALGVNG